MKVRSLIRPTTQMNPHCENGPDYRGEGGEYPAFFGEYSQGWNDAIYAAHRNIHKVALQHGWDTTSDAYIADQAVESLYRTKSSNCKSSTPRTDALLSEINEGRVYKDNEPMADLARELEKECGRLRGKLLAASSDSLRLDWLEAVGAKVEADPGSVICRTYLNGKKTYHSFSYRGAIDMAMAEENNPRNPTLR